MQYIFPFMLHNGWQEMLILSAFFNLLFLTVGKYKQRLPFTLHDSWQEMLILSAFFNSRTK